VGVSVILPDDFALERVVLHAAQGADNVEFTASELTGVPDGLPAPPTAASPALVFDLSVSSGGTPLKLYAATLQFLVDPGWLADSCPPATCTVGVLHWDGTQWETLHAERRETRPDGRVAFAAVTRSLSPFLVAALPPSADGFPPVEDGGDAGQVEGFTPPAPAPGGFWPVLLVLALFLILVSVLLVRQSRRRPAPRASGPPLPPPRIRMRRKRPKPPTETEVPDVPARGGRRGRARPPAPAPGAPEPEFGSMFGLMDGETHGSPATGGSTGTPPSG
jgi:hypothetical protein